MRFLHSGDWQIGMRAAHLGAAGNRVREERLAAARRVVEVAKREGAEFLLVAGDTFEDNAVDRVLVQKVADILAAFGGPVFVLPGNHDPLVPGSVWEHPAWQPERGLHVLRDAAPVPLAGGVLFPCPATAKCSRKDPTAWIPSGSGEGIRIGLAHGTVEGVRQDEPEYPVPRDAAQRSGLDYLALGHWHSTAVYRGADGAARMAYSGTHEPTKFGERDSGNVLLVEIGGLGAPPQLETIPTGGLAWLQLEEDLRQAGDLDHLVKRVDQLEGPEATLLELRLRGVIEAAERENLSRLHELAASRFLFARVDDVALRPAPGDETWISNLPAGVVREAALRLRDAAAGSAPAGEAGVSPEVAARALLELFALHSGGRP